MAAVTWLGDEDPNAVTVEVGGRIFVKGEAINVPDDELGKIKGNPTFSTEADARPVEAIEPAREDPEQGTEKAALKAEIRRLGGDVPRGNVSENTLREALVKLTKRN